jgi:phosphate-selective porin OprO and OprP
MRVCRFVCMAAALACLLTASRVAKAQAYAVGDENSAVTVSEVSYRDMLTRLEALEASLSEEKAKKDDGWKDTSAEKWVIKHSGRVHMDYVNYAAQNPGSVAVALGAPNGLANGDANDFVSFRRLYYGIEGEGYGIYDFKFEVDFADVNAGINQVRLKDVYFGIKEVPVLGHVRFGHFKIPMSMDALTSSRFISMMERSNAATTFCPERELGVAATRMTANENATLSYGLFFDELDERVKQLANDRMGDTFAIRGTWTPYYDEPSKGRYLVHTALSYKHTDDRDNSVRFNPRPEVQLGPTFIDTGVMTVDNYNTLGSELAAVWGSLSFQSEAYYVPVTETNGTKHDFYGAYVMGSWFLTGENRVYKRSTGAFDRLTPNTNFWAIRGAGTGSGAVETLVRWSYLDLSGTTSTLDGMQNDLTLGVNWYWNPNLKWMFNYIHSWNKYDNRAYVAENDLVGVSGRFDF